MGAFAEQLHPRNPKGAGGGEFKSGGGNAAAKQAGARPVGRRGAGAPHGSLSFNGKTGTGYGSKNGDPRVKRLQQALNRLHLTDADGKPLAVDGKLGPKTTAAIKRWQRKNGMEPTGAVSASDIAKLSQHKKPAMRKVATTTAIRARAAKKTTGRSAGK